MAYSSTAQITLVDEDFESGSASGWTTNTVANSGNVDFTQFLGRFDRDNGTIEKTFALGGSYTSVTVEFDFYQIDSWDNEFFSVFIDDVQEANDQFIHNSTKADDPAPPPTRTFLGSAAIFNGWGDRRYRYQFVLPGTVTSVKLGFSSNLNSQDNDESWGIDNVEISGTPTIFAAWDGVANDTWDTTARWSGAPSFPDATTLARIGINAGNNTVTVAGARAAIAVDLTNNGQLIIGNGHSLTVGNGITSATATTLGAGSTLTAASGTLAGLTTAAAGGTATVVLSGSADASHLVMANGDTFVKTGGALTFDLSGGPNSLDGSNTVQLSGGTLEMQAAGNPLGGATLQLNGGTFTVDGAASTVGNALSHFGYHTGPNGVMDLHSNGGMMGGGDPRTGATFFGNALLTTGPGNRGLDFNNDADFTNTGAIGRNDNYSNLWAGTLSVSAANAGNWEFRNAGDDDRAGIWLDLDQSGIFESTPAGLGTNRGEQLAWEDTGVKTVNLAQGDYLVAFTHSEGGGGSRADFRFKSPTMGGRVIVKPGDAAQAGLWTSMPVAGPIGMTSSVVEVLDDSTLNANTETTAAFGGLSYEVDSKTLTTTGAPDGMSFTGTTFSPGITSAGIAPATATNLGPINDAGVVGPLTITKTGDSDLNLDSTSTSLAATTTLEVREGQVSADYSAGNPSSSAQYLLSGGTLAVNANGLDMQTIVTVDGVTTAGLAHHGYHTGPNGVMDLDNNGGMMGGGDPTTGPTYHGSAVLLNGPGDRGLDFNQDSDFTATGAVGQNDNYSNLWVGNLTVSAANAGNWEFRNAGDDDRSGIWVDLDGDGIFESSTAGLGSNRGEQLAWEDTGVKTVNLAQGDYLVAFTHSEGGGGSRADFRFKSPTMGGQVIVKPGDAAQAGLWSIPITSTFELTDTATSNLQTMVMKQGNLRITGGSLLTVEQASISTATSGGVELIVATNTTLTDVSGLDGNGQTVTITKTGDSDLVLNKAGTNLGSATFLAKRGRLIGVSGGTNPFGTGALAVQGGEVVLASDSAAARTYDNALEVRDDGTLTAGAGGQGGNNATVTVGSVGNPITLTGGILTLQTQDGYSMTIPGAISGAGGISVTSDVNIEKAISAGSLDLSAVFNRTGAGADRAITAGDLFLRNAAGSLNIASGETLTVNTSGLVEGGATLQLAGTMAGAGTVAVDTGSTLFGTSASVTAPVTIQSGGTIAAGGGTLGDTLDSLSTGALTINDGGIYQWQLGVTGDQVDVTGDLTLDNNWTLHMVDATAPLTLGDQLLFAYTGTGSIGTPIFDTTGLPVSWQTAGIEIFHDVAGKKVYLRNLVVTAVAVGDLTWDGTNGAESEWSFGSGVDSHWDGGGIGDIPIFNLTATVDSGRVEVSAGNSTAHTLTVATGGNPAGEVEITSTRTLEITESADINSGGLVTITDGTLKANVNVNVNTGGTLDIAGSGAIEAIQLNNDGTSTLQAGASGSIVQLNVDAGTTTLATAALTITDTTVTGGDLNLSTDVPMATLSVTGGQVVAGANHAVLSGSMALSSGDYAISNGQTFGAGGTINSSKADRLNLNGGTLTITPPGAATLYTTGLEAWLDASTGVTVGGGNTVTLWADQSGNGRDATQNTGTGILTASELNGLPAVVFNANNETLNLGGSQFFAYDTFLVFRANNGSGKFGPSWGAPFGVQSGADNLRTWMFEPNQRRFWNSEPPGAVNWNGYPIGSAGNFDMTTVSNSHGADMDDYMVLKVTAGPNNNIGVVRPYNVGTRMDGWDNSRTRVAEILAFDHALNAANENSVGFYLASKYGIPTTYTDPNPTMDLSATAVNLQNASTLSISASQIDFSGLTLVSGVLTIQGSPAGVTFNGTTIGGASVGISTAVDVTSGAIDGGGLGATIVKSGTQDLLVQGAGSNLAGTTIDVQAGTLLGVAAPFGTATLQISGGTTVLSSAGGNVTYDNAVTVTADGQLTLGAGSVGASGALDLTLGNAGTGIAVNAGTLTLETTDSYQLIVPGTITGAGNIDIIGSSLQTDQGISAGAVSLASTTLATSGNITATTGALTLNGGTITSSGTVTISSTAGNVSINNTPSLTVSAGGHLTTFGGDSFGPLSYDFESGDLTGWSDVGTGFGPDNLFNGGNNPVSHGRMGAEQGSWYIDGYRTQANSSSDGHTGILESDSFILGPAASISFLIGGGSSNWSGDPDSPVQNLKGIGVEREVAPGDWENIHWESCGNCNTFQARNWDASAYAGETVRVRAYDTHTGGWGWTALDDLQISSRRDLTIYGALTLEAGSQLTLDDGTGPGNGSATFAAITTSTGPTINGNVIVTGAVRIDSSPETLNVTGNYTQGAGSTLHWEIDGASSDLINATGTIDGTADWNLEINPLAVGLTINGTALMTGSAPPAAPGTVTVTLTGLYSSLYTLTAPTVTVLGNSLVVNGVDPVPPSISVANGDWNQTGTWDITGVPTVGAAVVDGETVTVANLGATASTVIVSAGTLAVQQDLTVASTVQVGDTATLSVTGPTGSISGTELLLASGSTLALDSGATVTATNIDLGSGATLRSTGTQTIPDNVTADPASIIDVASGTLTVNANNVPSGLEAWLDASNGVTVDGSNTVTNWADQSGNGRDALQNTGTGTLTANEVNGLPAVVFGASNETLNLAGSQFFAHDTFLVFRANNGSGKFGPSWGAPFGVQSGADNLRTWMFEPNQRRFWNSEPPGAVNWNGYPIGSAGNFDMTTVSNSHGADMDDYMVLKVTAGPNNNIGVVRPYNVGTRMDGWDNSRCATAEVMAFDHALTADEENDVGGYLAGKYGIAAPNYTGNLSVEYGNLQVVTGATLQNIGGSAVSFGELSGGGTIVSNTIVRSQLAPGDTIPGTLTVTGDLTIASAASVVIEVDNAQTPKSDTLAVTGDLDITGGTLDFAFVGAAGGVYVIATYGSLSGTFASTNLPGAITIDYSYAGGTAIAITIPPTTGTVIRIR